MDAGEIEARLSIQATMSRYTRHVDTGRPDRLCLLFAEPMHVLDAAQRAELGYRPTPRAVALRVTIDWLRAAGKLPASPGASG